MRLDRPFREHIRLPFQRSVLCHNLKRTEKRVTTVIRKRHTVCPGIQQSILSLEQIIQMVQLFLLSFNLFIRIPFRLISDQLSGTVPDSNHAFHTVLRCHGQFHGFHAAVFPVIDLPVIDRIGKVRHRRISRDRMILFLHQLLHLIIRDLRLKVFDCLLQKFLEIPVRIGFADQLRAIRPGHDLLLAQYHFRVLLKIGIDTDHPVSALALFIYIVIFIEALHFHPVRQIHI